MTDTELYVSHDTEQESPLSFGEAHALQMAGHPIQDADGEQVLLFANADGTEAKPEEPESDAGEAGDATEPAAKLATDEGIDLATVTGTGKDGKITKGDVEDAVKARDAAAESDAAAAEAIAKQDADAAAAEEAAHEEAAAAEEEAAKQREEAAAESGEAARAAEETGKA
jgi:pyruvate/2-oxoglutarate dehydrogenase complex dihydrolipoamide acyltransferase (E2) component